MQNTFESVRRGAFRRKETASGQQYGGKDGIKYFKYKKAAQGDGENTG